MGDRPSDDVRVALRIIDANINRCAEGLRVVEEIARFSLDDETLMREAKSVRHEVRRLSGRFSEDTTLYRDSAGDVGGGFSTPSEQARESLAATVRANFSRAQEALRVIEEFGKLVRPEAAVHAKALRFKVYGLEKAFLRSCGESWRIPDPPFLYSFIDRSLVDAHAVGRTAAALIEGGSGMIQYRAKDLTMSEMRRDLRGILPLTEMAGVPLIVNDLPELAAETGAAGVHLGNADLTAEEARAMLGPSRIVGRSVRSPGDLHGIDAPTVDYVAVGAIYPTSTKSDAVVGGLEALASVRRATTLPLVAIGGITPRNADAVLDAGADGLAVISSVLVGDPLKNCFTFREIIDRRKGRIGGG